MAVTFGCDLTPTIFGPMASPEAVQTLARQAETLGFDAVWFGDHIVLPHRVASFYPYTADGTWPRADPSRPFYEPLSVLNFLAGCTQRVRLGTSVLVVPYRPPVLTAKILATLDGLSGGRLIVGAGGGWLAEEFQALGVPTYAERGAVTTEYLRLFKELWTQDEPQFHGKYCHVSGIGFWPKPVQKPHPPIWIGGHTDAALRRVAALGDGWLPLGLHPPTLLEPEEMAGKITRLRTLLQQTGRAAQAITIAFQTTVVFERALGASRQRMHGRPEQIAADLRQYQALGVQHFNVSLPGDSISGRQEVMEQFAHEVMPLVP